MQDKGCAGAVRSPCHPLLCVANPVTPAVWSCPAVTSFSATFGATLLGQTAVGACLSGYVGNISLPCTVQVQGTQGLWSLVPQGGCTGNDNLALPGLDPANLT